jgi:hypothetical protein
VTEALRYPTHAASNVCDTSRLVEMSSRVPGLSCACVRMWEPFTCCGDDEAFAGDIRQHPLPVLSLYRVSLYP